MAHRGLHKKHYWPERSIVWSRASAAAACKTLEWCERGHKDGRKSGCLLFHFADSFQGPDVLQTVIDSQLHPPAGASTGVGEGESGGVRCPIERIVGHAQGPTADD